MDVKEPRNAHCGRPSRVWDNLGRPILEPVISRFYNVLMTNLPQSLRFIDDGRRTLIVDVIMSPIKRLVDFEMARSTVTVERISSREELRSVREAMNILQRTLYEQIRDL